MQRKIENKFDYDLIIIGGGASGMMAAVVASSRGEKVLIIEHNDELGKKLKITGGGRCNILNAEYDPHILLSKYDKAKKYLHSAFAIFGVEESIKFFKDLGINIKIEDRKRAFPTSEKAYDVYMALYKELIKNKVEIYLSHKINKINRDDNYILNIEITDIKKNIKKYINAKRYIMATGGASHPETGSTGDGFNILKDLGFKIVEQTPSLVPVVSNTHWIQALSGRTLKNVKINIFVDEIKKIVLNNKTKDQEKNINILCTHFGISGPSIINTSKYIGQLLKEGDVTASIDLFKSMDVSELDKYILNVFDKNKKKKLKNVLNDIYPENILEIIFNANNSQIEKELLDKCVNDINREERRAMTHMLKDLKFNIDGLMGNDKAIVVDGGLDLDNIDMTTMKAKGIDNLQVIGDLLDISRPSGGYSLQLCWTTGYIAGISK